MIIAPPRASTYIFADYSFTDDVTDNLYDWGYCVVNRVQHRSPFGPDVTLLETQASRSLASVLLPVRRYVRLLDRYYVPDPPDPIVDTALCDYIAAQYEQLIDFRRNVDNISVLIDIILASHPDHGRQLEVLDFGCGTGLVQFAMARLPSADAARLKITGLDASQAMLEQAKMRGLRAIAIPEWLQLPDLSFDGGLASYVLHFGLTDREVHTIARQLSPSGLFVANYHKASETQILSVIRQFSAVGLMGTVHGDVGNPILKFVRSQR